MKKPLQGTNVQPLFIGLPVFDCQAGGIGLPSGKAAVVGKNFVMTCQFLGDPPAVVLDQGIEREAKAIGYLYQPVNFRKRSPGIT